MKERLDDQNICINTESLSKYTCKNVISNDEINDIYFKCIYHLIIDLY